MRCQIFNNMNSDTVREKMYRFDQAAQSKPIGKERQELVDSFPYQHVCDGQFHFKTRGNWGVDIATGLCPQYAGAAAVAQVKETSPVKQSAMTFETFEDSHRYGAQVKAWIGGTGPIMMLFGETGRGKTHLAKAAQYAMVESGLSVEMLTASSLAELFYESSPMRDDKATRMDALRRINRLKSADCVIVDDLGVESNTATFVEGFQAILDGMKGRLIVTTNLRADNMGEGADKNTALIRYGDRVFSRLTSGAKLIKLKGIDYRKRGVS